MRRLFLLIGLFFGLAGPAALADEIRPGYLELRQTTAETYDLLFKIPALGEQGRLALYVNLPDGVQDVTAPRAVFTGGAYVERRTIRSRGGLVGRTIGIDGLADTVTDVLVLVQDLAGSTRTERLSPTRTFFVVQAAPSAVDVAAIYLRLGFEHILRSVDHLLFVLGLLLLVKGWPRVVATITAFTIAHSLTLAAATLSVISVPAAPLNAMIALSILFLGIEVVRAKSGEVTLASRYPWVISFAFGLLHGCGFASGLVTTGLPHSEIPFALLFFNLGVEAGQLTFIGVFFALHWALRKLEVPAPRWAMPIPAYVVGVAGAYWTIAQLQLFARAIA
ncbi:HupE / UreJ protein [Rhizobiales bacterium GAS113]|nr:HupE / UreJ protein [Rhizobiales bacterium GAS113]